MNRERRKRLEEINRKLAELQNEVNAIIMEERTAFLHLPNTMLNSDRAKEMERDINRLDCMWDHIYDARHVDLARYPKTACMG